jgi:hypothetical protein
LQAFLDEACEARAPTRCEGLGLGEELVVDVEGGLHDPMIQISVSQ